MTEFSVWLRRHKGSTRPDVCIASYEDRDEAIRAMKKYCDKYGFSVKDADGTFTIANITLVEKEPVVGKPIISETSYCKLFDVCGKRIEEAI